MKNLSDGTCINEEIECISLHVSGRAKMKLKEHSLMINGKRFDQRGLDLAVNPFSGRVVGQVVLIPESPDSDERLQLADPEEEITEEITIKLNK